MYRGGGGSAEGLPQTMPPREEAFLSNPTAASHDVESDGVSDSGWDGHSPSSSHSRSWSSEWDRARLGQSGLADTEACVLSVPKRRKLTPKPELESNKESARRNWP